MSRPRALENIRVVDFSWVRAGPWATRWLGALGAEIIKIEWPENERGRLPSTTTPQNLEVNLNTSGNFNDTNVNKKSLSLNVRSAKGLEIVKAADRRLRHRDREFQLPGAAEMGPRLRRAVQDQAGHRLCVDVGLRPYRAATTTTRRLVRSPRRSSGLTYLSGLPDKPPAGWGWSYMDDTGGMYGAMCALTGLYHRNMTGQGQHIDQSQMVSSVPAQRSGAAGLHGERARVAPGRLSARQPRALAWHASGQQLPRADGRAAQRLSHPSRRVQRLVRDRLPLRRGMAATGAGDGRAVVGHARRSSPRSPDACSIRRNWTSTSKRGA